MKTLLFILVMFISTSVFAEDVVKHSGSAYIDCRSIGNTNVFLNDPNDYMTIKPGFIYVPNGCRSLPSIPRYRKILLGRVEEMSQSEKDVVDLAVQTARNDARKDSVDRLDISVVDLAKAIADLSPNFNRAQLKQKIKDNLGL